MRSARSIVMAHSAVIQMRLRSCDLISHGAVIRWDVKWMDALRLRTVARERCRQAVH